MNINHRGEEVGATPARSTLTLDAERYQRYLDEADLTEEQKRQFFEALWVVIVSFVDLGFEVRPANSCGEISETEALRKLAAKNVVELDDKATTSTFNTSADVANDQRERKAS